MTNRLELIETWHDNDAKKFEVIIGYHFFKKGHYITTIAMVIMKIGVLYSSAEGNISAIIQCFRIANVLVRLNFFIDSKFSISTNWLEVIETWNTNNTNYFEVASGYLFFTKGHNITTMVQVKMNIGLL